MRSSLSLSVLVACLLFGCQSQDDPKIIAQRAKILLAKEPDGAIGVIEARAAIEELESLESLVLVAKVGVSQYETWDPGRAAFLVRDQSLKIDANHDHEHDDNCPFCKAKKKSELNAMALVQFTDDQGRVLPIDARKLFRLNGDETVVVSGSGATDAIGNLVVSARGLYLRK